MTVCNPHDGINFCIENGILKAEYEDIDMNQNSLLAALQEAPVLSFQIVTDGWMPQNLSPVLGAIDESYAEGAGFLLSNDGGHATLDIGTDIHNGANIILKRNSWGRIGYNLEGVMCQTVNHAIRTNLAPSVKVKCLAIGPNINDWILR